MEGMWNATRSDHEFDLVGGTPQGASATLDASLGVSYDEASTPTVVYLGRSGDPDPCILRGQLIGHLGRGVQPKAAVLYQIPAVCLS